MDRRGFLQRSTLLAGAMCLDLKSFAQAVSQIGKPKLQIGVLSDIHIRTEKNIPVFQKALQYFRDKGVDGVIIAGDMADWGLEHQLQWVMDTWNKVFPKDKAPDGRHVERLFVYGNHDVEGIKMTPFKKAYTPEEQLKIAQREFVNNDRAKVWKKIFKEDWSPIYIKEIKFIGAHYVNHTEIPALESFLNKHKNELQGTKPFFYIQHMHPKNTCSAPWTWGQDGGKVTQLLSAFPNCVSFSGHSHTSLTDERTIWQGAFTSVGTASLSYVVPFGGRENSIVFQTKDKIPSQMPVMKCPDGQQGQYMTIYDDFITLERHDFVYDQPLGDNWIIPVPFNGALSFKSRTQKAKAPQFQTGDKVSVTRAEGQDRYGVKQQQLTVHFPTALKMRAGIRAFDYEVEAHVQIADVDKILCIKRVFSSKYYLGEAQDQDEAVCVFSENELLPKQKTRFAVTPVECFGKKGEAIYSEWQTI